MAASMSKLPTRTASSATTPPRLMTAVSLVPPPMSMTMLPTGSGGAAPQDLDPRLFACPTADVDDHVADRLVDRQVGADRGGHRLFDQLSIGRTRPSSGVGDGPALDFGDRRGDADDDLRPREAADADALQQQPNHPLGDLEVGDGASAQRT